MHISKLYPFTKLDFNVEGITNNSKKVRPNYIFVAIKGKKDNGKKYIKEALKKGAILIVSDKHKYDKRFIHSVNPKLEYIRLLQIFYGYRHSIYTIGITGTDGKTTTATLLKSIMNTLNESAYVGTNGIDYLDRHIETINTTPSPEIFYSTYQAFRKHHIHDLIMEVSSEGILDKRIENLQFDGAIFTNLSHEHLNTHKTMNSYFLCKAELFEKLNEDGLLVINADEKYSERIAYYTKAKIVTFGFKNGDYKIKKYRIELTGSTFEITYKGKSLGEFYTHLFGKYNIYNALAAITYAYELGIPKECIQEGLNKIKQVDGRFMVYRQDGKTFIIDYAHTPNALKNILESIREFATNKLIVITGAAGEKDSTKRAEMGKIATELADITIFTSEDPKNESLFNIFKDLTKEIQDKDYYLTLSREDAISLAYRIAKIDDIILIAGKGNEQTEKIKNYIFRHSDLDLVKKTINEKGSLI